jgi:hypothetical protein
LLCFGYQNIYNAQFMYNGRIMSKTWNEYNIENFHLVYGNNHFEPITMHNQIVNVVNVFNYNKNNQTSKKLKIK